MYNTVVPNIMLSILKKGNVQRAMVDAVTKNLFFSIRYKPGIKNMTTREQFQF